MAPLRLLYLFVFFSVCFTADVAFKNLAGPPSDFSLYALPTPLQSADVQNSATYVVNLNPAEASRVLTQTITLLVDSDEEFGFTFYSPNEQSIKLSLKDPKGHNVRLHGVRTYFPIGSTQVPGTNFRFKDPVQGAYILTATTKTLKQSLYDSLLNNTIPDAYIILWNEDALSTHTALNTYSLVTGNQVGLVTRVYNTTFPTSSLLKGMVPTALKGSIKGAMMSVVLPDGSTVNTPMMDDGLHSDELADDGIYGAFLTATEAGQYIFSSAVQGVNGDGVSYVRTTQQLVTVVEPTLTLVGSAVGSLDSSKTRAIVAIAADAPVATKYKAYAEVWGTDVNGKPLAVAWIGGMTYAQDNGGINSIALELDLNWISRVNAQEPFTLKNVLIQDPQTFVPIAQADEIPMKTTFSVGSHVASLKSTLIGLNGEITPEMLEGRRPEKLKLKLKAVNDTAAEAAIVLVHGYCTGANPYAKYASNWENAHFYLNPNKNFAHDDFANDVLDWADEYGPFSYVGHSQGGAVGLHLKNFYWSGMDLVEGGRILQSVGTPYQGSSGAGSAADLIKVFGVLCGANQDLTKDGAKLWIASLTPANKALVNYYTTTYKQGKFFGDYCNLATNLVLKWPNDGVAEYELAQLPGGQDQGNQEGWCHSVDMKYTSQCENQERNKKMNALAARKIKA